MGMSTETTIIYGIPLVTSSLGDYNSSLLEEKKQCK
jgi:hypothetical protein